MLALVLIRGFNLPDVSGKYNTAERKQPRRFLECVEDKFLTQLVSDQLGKVLHWTWVNREGLVGNVVVGVGLGHSNHEMKEF